MKIWIERTLAGLRWVWDAVAWRAKRIWLKLDSLQYDPPPLSYKRMLYIGLAFVVSLFVVYHLGKVVGRGGVVSAHSFMSEVGVSFPEVSTGYILPEPEPLPSVPTPAVPVPSVEVVCHDMSDTPQCEPVQLPSEKSTEGTQIATETNSIPPPVAKPKLTSKARKKVNRRKHQPYVTYWGF
jgi:hypothetical protein